MAKHIGYIVVIVILYRISGRIVTRALEELLQGLPIPTGMVIVAGWAKALFVCNTTHKQIITKLINLRFKNLFFINRILLV